MSAAPPTMQAFLDAADAMYRGSDEGARKRANEWLQDFQKTVGYQRHLPARARREEQGEKLEDR